MLKKARIFMEMIKLEHTIFALPFAFMGAILGARVMQHRFPTLPEWGWILMAMFGARSAAMALNRLIDATIDAKNPRTANRALPTGLLRTGEVVLFTVVSLSLLFWAAAHLEPLSVYLLPLAVFMLVGYSFTKRFTWLCHVVLGLTIALAPLGGWVAVTNEVNEVAIILYLTISFWIAGFDVVYACQDYEFDKQEGLKSIPVRFGLANSLWVARAFHILTVLGLITLLFLTQLSWLYIVGTGIASALLIYEHMLVKPYDLSRLNTSFFTMNGTLSLVVCCFTWMDLVALK